MKIEKRKEREIIINETPSLTGAQNLGQLKHGVYRCTQRKIWCIEPYLAM